MARFILTFLVLLLSAACCYAQVCPDVCRRRARRAFNDCRVSFSIFSKCSVNRCRRPNGRGGFTCGVRTSPLPSPAPCKAICRNQRFRALRDCTRIGSPRQGCAVRECKKTNRRGIERTGYECAEQKIEDPGDGNFTITIDGAALGDTLTYPLLFNNKDGGTPLEDFYLLVDATGSMRSAIATAKSKFLDIVQKRREVSTNVAFGVGFYRDESELTDGFFNSQSITTDATAVQNAINAISASGGGDRPEANLVALHKVATLPSIGWRTGARRILVYFGDAPGHEPTCPGSLNLNRATVIASLKAKKITVVAASFGSSGLNGTPTVFGCTGVPAAGTGQGTEIAEGTGGKLVSSSDQTALITIINDAVSTLPLTYTVDGSDCAAKLSSSYVPTFPFTLAVGESKSVLQTVTLNPAACPGLFNCEIKYLASGASLGTATVKVSNIAGC